MQTEFPQVPAIRRASRGLIRELGFLDSGQRTLGVSHAQCHAMVEIEAAGSCTVSELSEQLFLDKSTVSRTVGRLLEDGLIKANSDARDARKKRLTLTARGRKKLATIHQGADDQVTSALATLGCPERDAVARGLALYAKALKRSRLSSEFTIRPIRRSDDPEVAALIRTVMPEFGADGSGFAIHDPEVDAMSKAYRRRRAGYFVVERSGEVLGAGGYAHLQEADDDFCELRKMYFLPELRGLGLGARLLDLVLERATRDGYRECYVETLDRMHQARRLYEAKGFRRLDARKGATGHFGCDVWYAKDLPAL